jgi:hypothetical protein
MTQEKKAFAETGFGKFVGKAGKLLPQILDVGLQVATGNISGAISSVSDALKKEAETNVQAKQLLMELEQNQLNWALEMERIHAADRDSARNREVAMAQTGKKDWTNSLLAVVAVLAFGFALYVVAYRTIPAANREMFIHILGIIEGGMITQVFQYYFGSSSGSKAKTDMLRP